MELENSFAASTQQGGVKTRALLTPACSAMPGKPIAGLVRPVTACLWAGLAVGSVLVVQLYPWGAPLPGDPATDYIFHRFA